MGKKLLSILGIDLDKGKLDTGKEEERWLKWRPSVDLAMQPDLHFDEYYMIIQSNEKRFTDLVDTVKEDIRAVSSQTDVKEIPIELKNPWDFNEVYDKLKAELVESRKLGGDEWYINLTTGTHTEQICLYMLNFQGYLPGRLIQSKADETKVDRIYPDNKVFRGVSTEVDFDPRDRTKKQNSEQTLKDGIKTRNKQYNDIISLILDLAIKTGDIILLTGPTGAGKTKLARRIFDVKNKEARQAWRIADATKFIPVNCASLSKDMARAELFGYKKGAFTGAINDHDGYLKQADGGLLFLDEVAELDLNVQAELLTALDQKNENDQRRSVPQREFWPLGATKSETSSFQLVCGTNKDLQAEIAAGRFRADLFYRLNLWHFQLPGLKERPEDIEPNLDKELEELTDYYDGKLIQFSPSAREHFLTWAKTYPWPGNFREFKAMLKHLAFYATRNENENGIISDKLLEQEWKKMNERQGVKEQDDDSLLKRLLGDNYASRYSQFDLLQLQAIADCCRRNSTCADAGRELYNHDKKQDKSKMRDEADGDEPDDVPQEQMPRKHNDSQRLFQYLKNTFGLRYKDLHDTLTADDAPQS